MSFSSSFEEFSCKSRKKTAKSVTKAGLFFDNLLKMLYLCSAIDKLKEQRVKRGIDPILANHTQAAD
jgi:hypothetical protein